MKRSSAAALLGIAIAASGCGGHTRYELEAPTTTTVESPTTGAPIRCTNHSTTAQAKVPERGHGVAADADGTRYSASLQLDRRSGGALVVTCDP